MNARLISFFKQAYNFTKDFESIHMVLITATIYYYGIDTKTYEPKVTMLSLLTD